MKYRFFDLKKISVFVLDEADVMIATQGHQVWPLSLLILFRFSIYIGKFSIHISSKLMKITLQRSV